MTVENYVLRENIRSAVTKTPVGRGRMYYISNTLPAEVNTIVNTKL